MNFFLMELHYFLKKNKRERGKFTILISDRRMKYVVEITTHAKKVAGKVKSARL